MKNKFIKTIALTFIVVLLAVSLTSCSKPIGTYSDGEGTSYKFSLFNDKVTMIYLSIEIEGSYEIDEENGKIYITILDDRQEYTYSKDGKTIVIDNTEYTKD